MNKPLIVQTTVETKQNGQEISDTLIRERLAACCQLSGPVESRYRWQGKIENAPEYVLTLKTFTRLYPEVEQSILREHPYEVPEIIAFEISHISTSYLDWMIQELKS